MLLSPSMTARCSALLDQQVETCTSNRQNNTVSVISTVFNPTYGQLCSCTQGACLQTSVTYMACNSTSKMPIYNSQFHPEGRKASGELLILFKIISVPGARRRC